MNKKQAYEDQLKAQLEEWDAKINLLKAKAATAESEARVRYFEILDDLKNKQGDAKSKLQELRKASDAAWEEMKEGVETAWSRLGEAVKSASSHFK